MEEVRLNGLRILRLKTDWHNLFESGSHGIVRSLKLQS